MLLTYFTTNLTAASARTGDSLSNWFLSLTHSKSTVSVSTTSHLEYLAST